MPLPTVLVLGYLESAIAYRQLEQSLLQLGDWLPTIGGRPVTLILWQLDRTVKQMLHEHDATQVN
jgi:hypothetical protein